MEEILRGFVDESKSIISEMLQILEGIEEDPGRYKQLADVSLFADQMMGGAKLIALDLPNDHLIQKVAAFTELCKIVGKEGVKIEKNPVLTGIITAFLLDAFEVLQDLNSRLESNDATDFNEVLNKTMLERLKMLSVKFDENRQLTGTISKESARSAQEDIDALLKQMGV